MRKDIIISNKIGGEEIKVNVSEVARRNNCCWRTADKRVHPEKYADRKTKVKRIYPTILDPFKEMIDQKLENENIPATGIYTLLKYNYDYTGSYSTVKKYVSKVKKQIVEILTIRFNTIKGYQSQVDWKESLTLYSKSGEKYVVNIFLIVLGYSRYKYIELTSDRKQITLFKAITNAIIYFGGITETILFDNMSTIVDHAKSEFNKVVLNIKAKQFALDANFEIHTCRPYKPNTKGKVETLAKIMNRLKAFNYEFENWNDLDNIVKKMLYDLNYEGISQATREIPYERFKKEKEYLIPVNIDLMKSYFTKTKLYKVSRESMITYQGKKYSVPTHLVGESLSVEESDESINIYYNTMLINSFKKSNQSQFNYKKEDYLDILKQSVYKDKDYNEIEEIAIKNLASLDDITIE